MTKETPYIFAKNQVRMILRKGKDNAISRPMLKQITGMDDRTNRLIIEDLRCEGIPVMSSSSDKGYWLPQTASEVEHYINENRHLSLIHISQLLISIPAGQGIQYPQPRQNSPCSSCLSSVITFFSSCVSAGGFCT